MPKAFFYFMFLRVKTILIAALAAFVLPSCGRPLTKDAISAAELKRSVVFLSSDELSGRKIGTPGIAAAECFIEAAFRRAGLEPLPGRSGYFLDFPLYEFGFDRQATRLSLKTDKGFFHGVFGRDFAPLSFSSEGFASGGIVFAGYGIHDPASGYDDYAGLDVRGKIVLVFRLEPARFHLRRRPDGIEYSRRAHFTVKAETASRAGARAILFVSDPVSAAAGNDDLASPSLVSLSPRGPSTPVSRGEEEERTAIPAIRISVPFGDRLFSAAGLTARSVFDGLGRGRSPKEFLLTGASAVLACRRLSPPLKIQARNVAGFIRGSDPRKTDRWIVIGAHHDHIGTAPGGVDRIYNGADDNASGVGGVLELARVFSARSPRLAHSLVFITFSAEEEGLLGSEALFEGNRIPASYISALCNLDMLGRNPASAFKIIVRKDDDSLIGMLRSFLAGQALPADIAVAPQDVYSDDYVFARRGIPSFFFFSGLHADYHGVDDEADRIDERALEQRVRLIYDFIVFLDGR